jgi:multidrug efflux system outer membrane protein
MPRRVLFLLLGVALAGTAAAQTQPVPAPAIERVTFDEAVRRALEKNPGIGQAAQAILRAEALLDQARAVFRPEVNGVVATTVIDEARGFAGNITQPRRQTALGATISYPVLAASRWAARTQAADQVGIARISAEDVRRQVALAAAQSYLAVIAAQRQLEIAVRNRDTAQALADYARIRLEAGQGSRLNFLRSAQERAASEGRVEAARLALRQAQEALGVAIFAGGPVDAAGDPVLPAPAADPAGDEWLTARPDVRLFTAQVEAADRVARDTWKSWLPTGTALFAPRYVTPASVFEPADTWRAAIELRVPIFDGTRGATRRLREAERDTARLRLDATVDQARADLRLAREAVAATARVVESSRVAADNAAEALRITEIAYRSGATTNIEVVQAQQTARNAEIALAQAEDRHRQARLDLLVALGQFPG